MVTPSYSADCANVEHACHEGYARTCVIAYWRHLPRAERYRLIRHEMEVRQTVLSVNVVRWGATEFDAPVHVAAAPGEDRFLGVRDIYSKFDGKWDLALLEMLADPLLMTWVPDWVREQYARARGTWCP